MVLTVVASANVKTIQLVLKKMEPAIVPRQGGLGYSVISVAQGGTMESTVTKTALVRMVELAIQ